MMEEVKIEVTEDLRTAEEYFQPLNPKSSIEGKVAKYYRENATDNLLANAKKLGKNINDAIKYLTAEASELKNSKDGQMVTEGNCGVMTDEDCFCIMTHYFEEESIPKFGGPAKAKVDTKPIETQNDEDEDAGVEEKPVEESIADAKKKVAARAKEKKATPKPKKEEPEEEYNLFNMGL